MGHISAVGISKSFGGRSVLSGAHLEVRAGEAVGIGGANGSGKTTLLRICAGLLDPDDGETPADTCRAPAVGSDHGPVPADRPTRVIGGSGDLPSDRGPLRSDRPTNGGDGNRPAVLVGTPLGLAIGVLLPREMEAMLVLIGVGAISNVMPPEMVSAQVAPLWAPVRLLMTAMDGDGNGYGGPVIHGLVAAGLLIAITWLTWRSRVRVRTSTVSGGQLTRLSSGGTGIPAERKARRALEPGGLEER